MKSIFQNSIIHSLPILLMLVGGCESPDFMYPELEDQEKYFIRLDQQRRQDSIGITFGLSSATPLGDTTIEGFEQKKLSLIYQNEIIIDTVFHHSISFATFMKQPSFISGGFAIEVGERRFELPLPKVDELGIEYDSSFIRETDNDIELLLPFKIENRDLLDSFCIYEGQLDFRGVLDILLGDVNVYEPSKLHFLREFVVNDSFIRYPFDIFGISGYVLAREWNDLSKEKKLEYIGLKKVHTFGLDHLSSVRQFQKQSPIIATSANPFRLPQNITSLDDEGIFFGQFTALEVLRFKW